MAEIDELLKFDHPKEQPSIIKVLGVGGGGSNAVNHMFRQGIHGVDFVICNTDAQAILTSPVPVKIQLGNSLTGGNGAGSKPEVGMNAAIENLEDIREVLSSGTRMVFITAGMGGGTGTGGAPIIAQLAKEMGILTIGIVTIPFSFEGRKRRQLADQGIEELRKHVDTLLVINNDKLRELHGNLELAEAFAKADNILTDAAKGIAEIITHVGYINVDFEDVKTVMKDSGVAIMGTGIASGDERAMEAVEAALSSPLLNDNQITGASNVLLYIASGTKGIRLDEVTEITDYIQKEAGSNAEIIWGNGNDESLEENIAVTIIATGFNPSNNGGPSAEGQKRAGTIIGQLDNQSERHAANKQGVASADELEFTTIIKAPATDDVEEKSEVYDSDPAGPPYNPAKDDGGPHSDGKEENPVTKGYDPQTITMKNEEPERVSRQAEQFGGREEDPLFDKQERVTRLRELTMKSKSPEGLNELEAYPAYMRRNVDVSQQHNSADSEVSRFSLNEGEISENSHLHKKTD